MIRSTLAKGILRKLSCCSTTATQTRRRRSEPAARLEVLENRSLLSVAAVGIPQFVDQGPGTVTNGGATIPTDNPAGGAVNDIAVDPTNAARIFVASVNGGIWRTNNGTAASPTWTPLTDQFPSLSIGAIAFSPLDPSMNTLIAGTGNFSSGGSDGMPPAGLLKTTDGGQTWSVLADAAIANGRILAVLPTSLGTPETQVVLVATTGGIFRSQDGGETFDATPVLSGSVRDLDADPSNPNRFYASVLNAGFVRSDDGGATWFSINNLGGSSSNPISSALIANGTFLDLAVHANQVVGSNAIYAAIYNTNALSLNVYRSADFGANWTLMGPIPQIRGPRRAAIAADPLNRNVVFIANVPTPNGTQGTTASRTLRGDASQPLANQWTEMIGANANNTTQHADARDLAFDSNGNLLEANDGGLYRLLNPNTNPRWEGVQGNMRTTEVYSVAYDALNNTIEAGLQDNGTALQSNPGVHPGDAPVNFLWKAEQGNDGAIVRVDNSNANSTVLYRSSQGLRTFQRETRDKNNNVISGPTPVGLNIIGTNGRKLTVTDGFDPTIVFIQPWTLNSVAPSRMLIGTSFLYESTDRGDNLTQLGRFEDLNFDGLNNDGTSGDNGLSLTDEGDEFALVNRSTGGGVQSNPIAYGGRLNGVANPNVIWVGAGRSESVNDLYLRAVGNGMPQPIANYPGSQVQDIVLDPADWRRAFVVDVDGHIFLATSNNSGSSVTFQNLTKNLPDLSTDIRTIEFVRVGSTEVLLVGGAGGVFRSIKPTAPGGATWYEYGSNLPNVVVTDLQYFKPQNGNINNINQNNQPNDLLLIGTYGRGVWTEKNASLNLAKDPFLQVQGTNNNDNIRLERDENLPDYVNVFVNNVRQFQGPLASIKSILVQGLGGNDTISLQDDLMVSVSVNGGAGNDLIVGSPGDDLLNGDVGNDTIFGALGNDIIDGGDGADQLSGSNGDDTIVGGFGADIVEGDSGDDVLIGDKLFGGGASEGNDTLRGGTGWDYLSGGGGNDSLNGGADEDTLFGGNGNDRLDGDQQNDVLMGEAGNDTLQGDQGADTLHGGDGDDSLTGGASGANLPEASLDLSADVIFGDAGNDLILGDNGTTIGLQFSDMIGGDDTISGGSGKDTVFGQGGADEINGDQENDSLFGGDGDDLLDGGAANDSLHGGDGDDTLQGRDGNDTLSGGNDNDSLDGGTTNDSLLGGDGDDTLQGRDGNDTLSGGNDNDSLDGGTTNDSLLGGNGDDTLRGSDGNDTLSGGNQNDSLEGGAGDDRIFGGAGDDRQFGGLGRDSLLGDAGADTLVGEAGIDTLLGGTDDDLLIGGFFGDSPDVAQDPSADLLNGGNGNDLLFGDSGSPFPFNAPENAGGNDTLLGEAGIDQLYGQRGDDSLVGGADNDDLNGGIGNDKLNGDAGNDRLNGGDGNDSALGGDGSDTIRGDDGNDTLSGGIDDDLIFGGNDKDRLNGDAGNDILLGESGNDTLTGLAGRDLLFGGTDIDQLLGGDDQDLLISGETNFDIDQFALAQLRDEWSSARSYDDRILNLKGIDNPTFTDRLNGFTFLQPGSDDGDLDNLFGNGNLDWFLMDPDLDTSDAGVGEQIN